MRKRLLIALLSIPGIVAALFAVLQLSLNSRLVTNTIDKFAQEYIDGGLDYSDVKISLIKRFPKIIVEIDSLSITYPHDKFSVYDDSDASKPLFMAGRGTQRDTLTAFDRLYVTLNTKELLKGRIRLSQAELDNFSLYAHQYSDGMANWNILLFTASEDTVAAKPLDLPWVSLGSVSIGNQPRIVYTNQRDTVFAGIGFRAFNAGVDFKLTGTDLRLRDASLDLDSLVVVGRLPSDTLALRMNSLMLREPEPGMFDLAFDGNSMFLTKAFGRLTVPYNLDGRVIFHRDQSPVEIEVPHMDARIAYVPMHLDGVFGLTKDSTMVDARLAIKDCPIDTVLRNYADHFILMSRDIDTDARLTIEIEAQGTMSDSSVPHVDACVSFPKARMSYSPMDIDARLAVDIDAELTPDRKLSADIHEFHASIPGAVLDLDGNANDILGRNPRFSLKADVLAEIGKLMRFIPESVGVTHADGSVKMELSAKGRKSDLSAMHFYKNQLFGCLYTDSLRVRMNDDSLGVNLFKTDVDITSGPDGISLAGVFDSLYFNNGVGLIARSRNMTADVSLSKTEENGNKYPKIDFKSLSDRLFLKMGSNRLGLKAVDFGIDAVKRGEKRRQIPARRRTYTGGVDSLGTIGGFKLPDYLSEKDFAAKDIDISLDSSITRYLRVWSPEIDLDAESAFLATPLLPLRTRLDSICMHYTASDTLRIDSLRVRSGSTDILADATVTGLMRSFIRKGRIRVDADIESERLNINELLSAMQAGHADEGNVAPSEESDESFVTDTLANSVADVSQMSLVVVPANLVADLRLKAAKVDYSNIGIGPVSTRLKVQERTVQLGEAYINTEYGQIGLDAFYSTKTKKDISAGIDMRLKNMSANEIISLMPSVDNMLPALKSFHGLLNCDMSATMQLDTNMNVVIPTLDGLMRITGRNLEIQDAGDFRKVTKMLMFKNQDIGHIDDLSVDAVVHDSKLEVFPFELGVDRYRLAMRGMQGFDRSIYYHISILKSPFLFRFGVNIFGTLDNWRFNLCKARYQDGKVPAYTTQLDSVQINMARSIKNIYNRGVDNVMRYNGSTLGRIQNNSMGDLAVTDGSDALSSSDMNAIDRISVEMEMQQQQEDVMLEVEEALNATQIDTDSLMKEYSESAYDKRILRQLEKLKERFARKKKNS